MTRSSAIQVGHLGVHGTETQSPLWWGIWGLILIEGVVFATLLACYFYLRLGATNWPPAGTKPPDLLLPTLNTFILLASAVLVHKADAAMREGNRRWVLGGLAGSVLLAATFLTIKYVEYSGLSYRWNSDAYGSIVWTITGFHTAHVIVAALKGVVLFYLVARGYLDAERRTPVHVAGIYWQFVVIVWLPIYATLYFAPRVLD